MKVTCEKCGRTKAGTGNKFHRFFTPVWMLCWGHKTLRVSELNRLTKEDLDSEDLILVSDMSEKESKQIKVGDLVEFLKAKV